MPCVAEAHGRYCPIKVTVVAIIWESLAMQFAGKNNCCKGKTDRKTESASYRYVPHPDESYWIGTLNMSRYFHAYNMST